MMTKGLGWFPSLDPRNLNFLSSAAMHPIARRLADLSTYKMHWANGWWGDQENTPHCVIYSWMHLFADGPVTHPTIIMPFSDPLFLYLQARKIDNSTATDPEGLSCLAGAKVFQQHRVMTEYRWVYTLKDMLEALAYTPVALGLWWYTSMFRPDSTGLIKIGGIQEGGHQIVLNGYNKVTRRVRGKNSWGRGWGRKGFFEMSFDDVERHFREGAEGCVPTELLKWSMPAEQ